LASLAQHADQGGYLLNRMETLIQTGKLQDDCRCEPFQNHSRVIEEPSHSIRFQQTS
jgi:hypothetical protein